MPSRRFSHPTDGHEYSEPSVGVFAHRRSGSASDHRNHPKRRKTGLNAKFDQMVRSMDATIHHSTRKSRRRSAHISSSSRHVTLADARTPPDDNSSRSNISLIRLKSLPVSDNDSSAVDSSSSISSDNLQSATKSIEPLPAWLSSTLTTLAPHHPLRILSAKKYPNRRDSPVITVSPERYPTHSSSSFANMSSASHQPTATVPTSQLTRRVFPSQTEDKAYSDQAWAYPPHDLRFKQESAGAPLDLDQLDFVPFMTPGPASTISQTLDPPTPFNLNPSSLVPPPGLPSSGINKTSPISYESTALHSSPYDLVLSDTLLDYSSDALLDYNHIEDTLTDDSISEPPLNSVILKASELCNVFATPGPGCYTRRSIYFESPTEHPSDEPDPAKSCDKVDYSAVDFCWKPFNRNGAGEVQILNHNQTQDSHEQCSGYTCATQMFERSPSPDIFRFLPYDQSSEADPLTRAQQSSSLLPPQIEHQSISDEHTQGATEFAPAPGIYISPLRANLSAS